MTVHAYTATASSCHRTLNTAGDTDVITLDTNYSRVQVVLTSTTTSDVTVYVDRGTTGPGASFEPTLGADGTWKLTSQGDTVVMPDDSLAFGAPASTVRIRCAAVITYSVYGLS